MDTLESELTSSVQPLESGAVPLFDKAYYPWKGLPYPKHHAELGIHVEEQVARKMAAFQQATLDHHLKPIASFFNQEKGEPVPAMEEANRLFFKMLEIEPAQKHRFIDKELGIWTERDHEKSVACFASGCLSGMGSYLFQEMGFVNFAPQFIPLGDCSNFGLAGRGAHIEVEEGEEKTRFSYQCRLGKKLQRAHVSPTLQDAGYSGMWVDAKMEIKHPENALAVSATFEGFESLSNLAYVFFAKAPACYVSGSHRLKPQSLDRYQGPVASVELRNQTNSLHLKIEKGFARMEVIPLAGDQSFWGADFLIAFIPKEKEISFKIHT